MRTPNSHDALAPFTGVDVMYSDRWASTGDPDGECPAPMAAFASRKAA